MPTPDAVETALLRIDAAKEAHYLAAAAHYNRPTAAHRLSLAAQLRSDEALSAVAALSAKVDLRLPTHRCMVACNTAANNSRTPDATKAHAAAARAFGQAAAELMEIFGHGTVDNLRALPDADSGD